MRRTPCHWFLLITLIASGLVAAGVSFHHTGAPARFSSGRTQVAAATIATYVHRQLRFEANEGQADTQVKFLARGEGYTMFLTPTETVLSLDTAASDASRPTIVTMTLQNANAARRMVALDELPGRTNYFIGNDSAKWRTNVPTYARVKHENVYPGVDLVYYGNRQQLEYDFVVAPGADLGRIAFTLGPGLLEVDSGGDLILWTSAGKVRQLKPTIYQQVDGVRRPIVGRYIVARSPIAPAVDVVGFEVGEYDHTRPLVIDPVLVSSMYLGGSGQDVGFGLAVGSDGSAYLTGFTSSADFPKQNPLQSNLGAGNPVAFVAKLNPAGTGLAYSTYLGGSGYANGVAIAVDSANNAYVTGFTNASDFPATNPLASILGGFNGFVTKLNDTGSSLVYSTFLGGSGDDGGASIGVDGGSSAFVTGWTNSANFPIASALQQVLGGGVDAFVMKLTASGAGLVYSTYLGGSGDEYGNAIALDFVGQASITGFTSSVNLRTAGPVQAQYGGGYSDAFVAKVNPAGSGLVYSSYLGGSGDDSGHGVAVDAVGNAHVTGRTTSADFPIASAFQPLLRGGVDAFAAKLTPSGSAFAYSTYLGGTADDVGNGIVIDAAGNTLLTGSTGSVNFPLANPLQSVVGGPRNAFVTKLTPAGSGLVFSTYLGGSGSDGDFGFGIRVDTAGNAYVSGSTTSANFPTASPFQPVFGGVSDAFLAKIFDAPPTPSQTITNLVSQVNVVSLPATVTGPLTSTLAAATVAFDRGQTNAGVNQLQAFMNQVNAQSGKSIPTATADALIAAAQSLISVVGGR